jgi:hypothetical protein
MKEWNQQEIVNEIDLYVNQRYTPTKEAKDKIFYHYTEWRGWRFWLKALRYRDWPSIKSHMRKRT